MTIMTRWFFLSLGLSTLSTTNAFAQGCIIGRQCTPGAANKQHFLHLGEREYGFTYRTFRATDHYVETKYQISRQQLKNNVINRQNIIDLVVTQGVGERSNLTVDLPIMSNGWSLPRPLGSTFQAPGPRYNEKTSGIGDLSLLYKTSVFSPDSESNIILGVGLKLPTGRPGVQNVLPDLSGNNPQPRTVDPSIQLGDGSLGFPVSVESYKSLGKVSVFFTGNYLLSPRNTNGVASGFAPTTPSPSIGVFSVPDQFLYRLGVSSEIPGVKGLSGALSWRKEGVPQKDLIGKSQGFRRPGYSTSIEPSLTYSRSGLSYTLAMPITQTRNSQSLNSDGSPVDSSATFAKHQFIFNVSKRVTTL
jgi:hypothetical protein